MAEDTAWLRFWDGFRVEAREVGAEGPTRLSLRCFFQSMGPAGCARIGAVAMDMNLGLLVEREATHRHSLQFSVRLHRARLRFAKSVPEDIDYRTPRGLDRAFLARLLTGEWVRQHQNVILVAPTGLGKTWLACALVNQACRQGFSAAYLSMPKFNEETAMAHASARFTRLLTQWATTDILVLDDLAMTPLTDSARRDLLELLADRHQPDPGRALARCHRRAHRRHPRAPVAQRPSHHPHRRIHASPQDHLDCGQQHRLKTQLPRLPIRRSPSSGKRGRLALDYQVGFAWNGRSLCVEYAAWLA